MRAFWISFDRISGILSLLGLVAPFVLAVLGLRKDQARRRPTSVPHFGFFGCSGCALGSALGFFLLYMVTCFGPPPGRGEDAEMGYTIAAPILSALERYHADHGSYPDALRALAPEYLRESQLPPLRKTPRDIGDEGFAYVVDISGFTMGFRYDGPGKNYCIYKSTTRRWSCGGLF